MVNYEDIIKELDKIPLSFVTLGDRTIVRLESKDEKEEINGVFEESSIGDISSFGFNNYEKFYNKIPVSIKYQEKFEIQSATYSLNQYEIGMFIYLLRKYQ